MNYEEMSNLQINLLVANAIGVGAAENSGVVYGSVKHSGDNVVSVIGVVDYCSNPSDAWPIIMSNFISIDQHYNGSYMRIWGYCEAGEVSMQCLHKDALRTAMIVFLNMSDTTCQKK